MEINLVYDKILLAKLFRYDVDSSTNEILLAKFGNNDADTSADVDSSTVRAEARQDTGISPQKRIRPRDSRIEF
ncbi:MAG TPA: hypothetical protein PKY81_10835 [bacterium]|nr:hypothetical protein [bacterium]